MQVLLWCRVQPQMIQPKTKAKGAFYPSAAIHAAGNKQPPFEFPLHPVWASPFKLLLPREPIKCANAIALQACKTQIQSGQLHSFAYTGKAQRGNCSSQNLAWAPMWTLLDIKTFIIWKKRVIILRCKRKEVRSRPANNLILVSKTINYEL